MSQGLFTIPFFYMLVLQNKSCFQCYKNIYLKRFTRYNIGLNLTKTNLTPKWKGKNVIYVYICYLYMRFLYCFHDKIFIIVMSTSQYTQSR